MGAVLLGGCVCLQPVAEFDGGPADSGQADSGMRVDGGSADAGGPDAGEPDAGEPDAGESDAGESDAGEPDAGAVDASVPIEVNLEASTDRLDGVLLSWDAGVAPVLGFFIERDGVVLASARFDERTYLDTQAGVGWLEAPGGVVASEKEKDGIGIAWDASVADAGSEHRYLVRAEVLPGDFVSSSEARGWRAAPSAELYEVQRADGGRVTLTPALSAFDQDAGGWSLDASVDISVEEDDFRTTVILSADASISIERFPESYRVRAMQSDGGAASAWSPVVTGRRTDELYVTWQWQRSAGSTNSAFADLPRVMGRRWFDPYPVLDETRFYRLALRVERLGEVVSSAKSATLYRPLKLALGNYEGPPTLCVLRSDGALHCRNRPGVTPREIICDAGTDIVELEGSPVVVCARRSDAGAECWGEQVVQPPAGPLLQLSVSDWPPQVCGLDVSRTAVCSTGAPATPDGGWAWFIAGGDSVSGIREVDRAFQFIPAPFQQDPGYVRPGPYLAVYVPGWGNQSPSPVGILIDGGIDWFVQQLNSYPLPPAPGGYRSLFAHGYATCGLRNDGYALCRGTSHWVARTTTNVAYRELIVLPNQACGITTDDHVECWHERRYDEGGTFLPPRMPVRDLYAGERPFLTPLKFIDETGRFFEYAEAPLREASITPDDRFTAIPRPAGADITLVRIDGGVVQWFESKLPAGSYVKVDGWCGLEAGGTVRCDGWSPQGIFLDVVGNGMCGLRPDGGIECNDGSTPLTAEGPFTAISESVVGVLCAQRQNGTVVCHPSASFPELDQPVVQFDVSQSQLCGVLTDGGVVCVPTQRFAAPTLPAAPPGPYRKVSAGDVFACGIRTDGTAVCWASEPGGVPLP